MTGRTDIDALLRIMPNDHGADERVDWAAVEAHLGTSLPSDYQAFMAVYGGGAVDTLVILPPLSTGDSWSGSISEHTELADSANDGGVTATTAEGREGLLEGLWVPQGALHGNLDATRHDPGPTRYRQRGAGASPIRITRAGHGRFAGWTFR